VTVALLYFSGKYQLPGLVLLTLAINGTQLVTYFLTAMLNPGYVSASSPTPHRFCEKCQIHVAKRTLHCYTCKRCVEDMDHHCPWVGKCIGRHNLYYFYAFLISTIAAFIYMFGAFFYILVTAAALAAKV
jgi:palmitoyltransferase ZDHHC9/14/18